MISYLRKVFGLFKPKPERIDFCFVSYTMAERLIREGWRVAKEDRNYIFGMVYLEKLEIDKIEVK